MNQRIPAMLLAGSRTLAALALAGVAIGLPSNGTTHAQPAGVVTPGGTVTVTETILPFLGTGEYSGANAVNEKGQVVGWSATSGLGATRHAFLWADGQLQDLGTLGGPESFAYDINASGVVVGHSSTSSGEPRGFLWDGELRELDNLSGYDVCLPMSISNSGVVAGYCYTSALPQLPMRGVLWSSKVDGGAPVMVADPPLADVIELQAISSAGRLAGAFVMPGSVFMPAIWSKGIATQLAVPSGFAGAELFDLNARGESVGVAFSAGWAPLQATLWTKAGEPIAIAPEGDARAINDDGEVVGDTYQPATGTRAFFWSPSTGLVPMGNGVWANDVNNGRVAVGEAYVGGQFRAAVWTVTITP